MNLPKFLESGLGKFIANLFHSDAQDVETAFTDVAKKARHRQ